MHRPRYDDWSFPKGKLDRGEYAAPAAVREVAEETGLHVRLGPALTAQRYPVGSRMKTVHYWSARAVGSDDVSDYRPNAEIDAVAWISVSRAADLLSYHYDRATLAEARRHTRKTRAIVVLRHARARSRKQWRRDDRQRPLIQPGHLQAQRLVPLLAAFDVTTLVTSSSTRCVQTVQPYADTTGWPLLLTDAISEEDATTESVIECVDELLVTDEGAVMCSHRPVLPSIFDVLGIPDPGLALGAMLVAHHRKGTVVATEEHDAG